MNLDEKLEFYKMLIKVGFKEIEVGFPAASETEYEFLRRLVEDDLIPDDVTIQVLTQAREHIIRKTFEALKGVKNAVVHVYNSTSVAQREQVFRKSKEEIKEIVEEAIYGWTVPAWKAINTQTLDDIYEQIDAKKKVYPKGSDPFVRPLFDEDCYWGVDQIETTVTPRLSQEDVRIRLLEQWQRKHRRH
jgi:hypothetical protein